MGPREGRGEGEPTTDTATDAADARLLEPARPRGRAVLVDNRRPYWAPEAGEFWDAAPLLKHFLGGLGVALAASDDVLEIGCGVGRMTRLLAAQAGHVAALDVSDEMLARARDLNPDLANVRWELGDGVSLSGLTAGSFDACMSTVVLQHVPDPEITLGYVRELGRVLRPGGWAALQVPTDPAVHRPRAGLRRQLVAAVGRGPRGQRHSAWLGAPVSVAALQATAVASGLSLERVWGAGSQYCQILLRRA